MADHGHSLLSPSAAERWATCGGSFHLHAALVEAGLDDEPPSPYAALGTAAHALAELCLRGGTSPADHLGETIEGHVVGLDDGQVNPRSVAVYVEHVRGVEATVPGVSIYERHLMLTEDTRGTVDFARIGASVLHVVDYKNGSGYGVDAVGNKQMLLYAYLVIRTTKDIGDLIAPTSPVTMTIVQPNLPGEPPVKSWTTTVREVLDRGGDLYMRAVELRRGKFRDEYVPGDYCRFCPVALVCPRLSAAYHEFAQSTKDVPNMEASDLAGLFDKLPQVEAFTRALKAKVEHLVLAGTPVATAKAVLSKSTGNAWKELAALRQAAYDRLGKDAFALEMKSPAQVRDMSLAGREFYDEYSTPRPRKITVVHHSDKRETVPVPKNSDIFQSFTAED